VAALFIFYYLCYDAFHTFREVLSMKHIRNIIPGVLKKMFDTSKAGYLRLYQKYDGNFEKMSRDPGNKLSVAELTELAVMYEISPPAEGRV